MAAPKRKRQKRLALTPEAVADLFPQGSAVLIGLSGGADSVALTHLLSRLVESRQLSVSACHINHRLRGVESAADSEFCELFCDRLEIPYISVELDVAALAKSQKLGLEEAGREARHFILEQIAIEDEFDLISLGHHADDQVETVLFRLFRGTGPAGLAGISERRGKIIRPLLDFTREAVMEYLERNGLEFREDSSNLSEDFARNYIRHSVLPVIEKRFPALRGSVFRLAEVVGAESEWLEAEVERVWGALVKRSPGGAAIVDNVRLAGQPLWLKRRLLRRALAEVSGLNAGVDFATIDRLVELCDRGSGGVSLPNGLRARIERGGLFVFRGSGARIKKRTVVVGKTLAIEEISSLLKTRELRPSETSRARQKRGLRVNIKGAAIEGGLVVRSARPSDRFAPLGLRGSKSLGDFFTDRKVPTPLRGEVPVVCDELGIVWVAGHQIADRVKLPPRPSAAAQPLELEMILQRKSS